MAGSKNRTSSDMSGGSFTDDQIAQFHREEPGLHVTITISGKLTYNKELLEHLKP
jgi:hypothetical protein